MGNFLDRHFGWVIGIFIGTALAVLVAILVAGALSDPSPDLSNDTGSEIAPSLYTKDITVNGRTIPCVIWKESHGGGTGQFTYSGIDCDWHADR